MSYLWHTFGNIRKSKYWTAVFRNDQNAWVQEDHWKTAKTKALALAIEWERAAHGPRWVLTESLSREIIGGILERTHRREAAAGYAARVLRGMAARQDPLAPGRHRLRYAGQREPLLRGHGQQGGSAYCGGNTARLPDGSTMNWQARPGAAPWWWEMKTISSVFNHARRLGSDCDQPGNGG